MSADAMATAPMSGSPVRFDVEYQEKHSRLLIFFRWILAIPHLLILYALGAVASVCVFIAFFTILFTKGYPKGLFDFVVNTLRWSSNVSAYILMLRDEYPPFSFDAGQYPVTLEIDYPAEFSRFAPLYKWLIIIPNLIALVLVAIVAYVLIIVAWFAILFTGSMPRGIHDFITGMMRWSTRVNAYAGYLLRDEYPPFSTK
jgi:hypothetical protein